MHVKFVDLQKQYVRYKSQIDARISRVLSTSNFIHGPDVAEFETNFAKYIGTKHCIGVANGTDALEIAVKSCINHDNSSPPEIIVQGNTYIASCLAATNNSCKLVVADCDAATHMISYADLISKCTANTKIIILVHLFGIISPDIEAIQELCKERGIILIEDCAQAHGAKWKNAHAGTFGDISCFSFYPGKNLGAFGDAGGICTNNDTLAMNIRKIANLGCIKKYYHELIGRNSRLDTIQAAILDEKLKFLDEDNEKRRKFAEIYKQKLQGLVELPDIDANCTPVFHLFVIKTSHRDILKKYLESHGIECGIHYPISITEVEAFRHLNLSPATNCIRNSKEILSLPIHSELTINEVDYVCTCISTFLTHQNQFNNFILANAS